MIEQGAGITHTDDKDNRDNKAGICNTSDISAIICTYSEERWDDLRAAVASLQAQDMPPREIIVIIDHNLALLERVREQLPDVVAIENVERRGLSGARNSGIAVARGSVIAFFDDDVIAEPDCLRWFHQCLANPNVAGVGGRPEPSWTGTRPEWFPREFYWVVGCSYKGLPERQARIRNPIGCCCCFRREVFELAGGFRHEMGRIGKHPLGCEETELCIRARQCQPGYSFLYEPRASIQHRVPLSRTNWRYFCARCYAEGLSKAMVAHYVGTEDALASERAYVQRVLPLGIAQGLWDTLVWRDGTGMKRAGAIVAGLAMTTAGYVVGRTARELARFRYGRWRHILRESLSNESLSYAPARMLEIELGQSLPPLCAVDEMTGRRYIRAYCLVRLHGRPLGMIEIEIEGDEVTAGMYAGRIWEELGEKIVEHLREDGLPPVTGLDAEGICSEGTPPCIEERDDFYRNAPFVSIVLPTHERVEQLRRCLQSLMALRYPAYEILVVDNTPVTSETADFIRQTYGDVPRVHYLCEERKGAARARNYGIEAAQGEIVAFTDDDAVVDADWLLELVRGFGSAKNVACVTGLVLPQEMETAAQFWFEEYGGFSKNFRPRIFDRGRRDAELPLHPYTTGQCGSGVSMACSADFLRSVRGFDVALGPGVAAQAGEDLAMFFQVITRGYRLAYTPNALLYHLHRRNYADLRQQMYSYGIGLGAYLMKNIYDAPGLLFDVAAKMPYGLYFMLSQRSSKNAKKTAHYPAELSRLELKGMLYGPFAYVKGRMLMGLIQRFRGR